MSKCCLHVVWRVYSLCLMSHVQFLFLRQISDDHNASLAEGTVARVNWEICHICLAACLFTAKVLGQLYSDPSNLTASQGSHKPAGGLYESCKTLASQLQAYQEAKRAQAEDQQRGLASKQSDGAASQYPSKTAIANLQTFLLHVCYVPPRCHASNPFLQIPSFFHEHIQQNNIKSYVLARFLKHPHGDQLLGILGSLASDHIFSPTRTTHCSISHETYGHSAESAGHHVGTTRHLLETILDKWHKEFLQVTFSSQIHRPYP